MDDAAGGGLAGPGGGGSPWRALLGLLLVVAFVLLAWFVWQQVARMAATQDCVASGRRDCVAVPQR